MLTKKQKTWMWIFLAMFVIPEILFSFTLSVLDLVGKNIRPIYLLFVNKQFFIDHPFYLLFFHAIELLGVVGLLVIGKKSNKKILVILLGIILLWLVLDFLLGFVLSSMSPIF